LPVGKPARKSPERGKIPVREFICDQVPTERQRGRHPTLSATHRAGRAASPIPRLVIIKIKQ